MWWNALTEYLQERRLSDSITAYEKRSRSGGKIQIDIMKGGGAVKMRII